MAIELIDQIKQKNNGDFPLVDCNDILGGVHHKNTEEDRDAIPFSRRKIGMTCTIEENGKIYQLIGGIENINWQPFNPVAVDILDINNMITSALNRILALESKVKTLEDIINTPSTAKAVCGEFLSGELKASEGITQVTYQSEQYEIAPISSSLSDSFKSKLKKVGEENGNI